MPKATAKKTSTASSRRTVDGLTATKTAASTARTTSRSTRSAVKKTSMSASRSVPSSDALPSVPGVEVHRSPGTGRNARFTADDVRLRTLRVEPITIVVNGADVDVTGFRTEFLIEKVGSVTGVAELLGVSKSQPTRWRKGEERPSPQKARMLSDLEHVFSRAALIFEGAVINDWMTGPNSYLEGARPIDVLRTRGVSEVLDALDAAEQLAFG